MYTLSKSLLDLPVLSLQTGQTVTQTTDVIIDPSSLTIVAIECGVAEDITDPIVLTRDIREFAVDCILVNSEADISETADIVRLKALVDDPFTLMHISVVTEGGTKLGRVEDYTIATDTFKVQKLYVQPAFIKGLFGSSLIIDRSQITDVTNKQITVKETTTPLSTLAESTQPLKPKPLDTL